MSAVYKITNNDGYFYIGSTENISRRKNQHKYNSTHVDTFLHDFLKNGYIFEILEENNLKNEDILMREAEYLDQLFTEKCINQCSPIVAEWIKRSNREQAMKEWLKNNPNYHREWQRNKYWSDEHYRRAKNKQNYQKYKEKDKIRLEKWIQNNRQHLQEYKHNWYVEHYDREKQTQKQRERDKKNKELGKIRCDICDRTFPRKSGLRSHEQSKKHLDMLTVVCDKLPY